MLAITAEITIRTEGLFLGGGVLSVSGTDVTGSSSHYIWKNSAATKQASGK
jgi:hypothetical protein